MLVKYDCKAELEVIRGCDVERGAPYEYDGLTFQQQGLVLEDADALALNLSADSAIPVKFKTELGSLRDGWLRSIGRMDWHDPQSIYDRGEELVGFVQMFRRPKNAGHQDEQAPIVQGQLGCVRIGVDKCRSHGAQPLSHAGFVGTAYGEGFVERLVSKHELQPEGLCKPVQQSCLLDAQLELKRLRERG